MNDQISNINADSLIQKCPYYSRIGHQVIKISDEVLIIGGSGPKGQFVKPILRFNLQNFKIDTLSNTQCPNIQGFSTFIYGDTVYLWGGAFEKKPSNILWSFKGSNFQNCAQSGQIPLPRAFHESIFIANRYLLIYGGFNETEIFNDWYIFDTTTFKWSSVQSNIELARNMKYRLVWGYGRGFLMSQYEVVRGESKAEIKQKNELYELRITNFMSYKIRIDRIQYYQKQLSILRINFSLYFINKYLFVIGGEIIQENSSIFCNDIWILNIQTMSWNKNNIQLNVKNQFQIVSYQNKLYLIGGLKSNTQMSNIVEVLTLNNTNSIETKICNFCKSVYNIPQKTLYKNQSQPSLQIEIRESQQHYPQISTSFISKISKMLQNPIQAIGLLLDNSINMGSSLININIYKKILQKQYYKQHQHYYLFIGDNSQPFESYEIVNIIINFKFKAQKNYHNKIDKQDAKIRNQYGINLKIASLRLGHSCLFITYTYDQVIFVAYFSDRETDCPDGDPCFNCFYYTIDKKGNCSNRLNRHIIKQNIEHIIPQSQFFNISKHKTKVYIFGLRDVVKIQTAANEFDVICTCHYGPPLSKLSQYVSVLYFPPFLGREIYIEQNRLGFINLANKLKQDEKKGEIELIDNCYQQDMCSKITLYKIKKLPYFPNYIHIYNDNRLIYTISTKQKTIVGYIQILSNIQINLFKSKIENIAYENKFIKFIQHKQYKSLQKRQRINDHFKEQDNVRKIKNSIH